MLQALLLASLLLPQDKPAKTVEERLKELDEKIAALEKKHKTLSDENASMEIKIVEAKVWKENFARQTATSWVKQYAAAMQLNEKQKGELETLWYDWTKEDQEKPNVPYRWMEREKELRSKLSPEQAGLLCRKVREDQERNAQAMIGMVAKSAKLTLDRIEIVRKAAMPKLKFEEDVLLPQAHPEKYANSWGQTLSAVDSSIPELSSSLSEDEVQALRKLLDQWKPKQR